MLIFTLHSTGFHSLGRNKSLKSNLCMAMLPMHLFLQMQCPSLILILVLALALAQCTWMKLNALEERLTSRTALEAQLSAVLLSTHIQEYDVKVCENSKIMHSGMIKFAGLQVPNIGSL